MDTYGLINLNSINGIINDLEGEIKSRPTDMSYKLIVAKTAYEEIKKHCLKFPDAEKVFNAGRDAADWKGDDRYSFEDYMSQYTKSEREVEYEAYFDSEFVLGWYPISADRIIKPENIEQYIKDGLLRIRK